MTSQAAAPTALALRAALGIYLVAIVIPPVINLILSLTQVWYYVQWLTPTLVVLLAVGLAVALCVAAGTASSRSSGARGGAMALGIAAALFLALSGFTLGYSLISLLGGITVYLVFLSWALIIGFRGWGYFGLLVLLGSNIILALVSALVAGASYALYSSSGSGIVVVVLLSLVELALWVGAVILTVRLSLHWERRQAARPPRSVAYYPSAVAGGVPVAVVGVQAVAGGQPSATPVMYVPSYYVDRTNGLAVAALILGILSFTWIPIVLGHVALSQIARNRERGRGMAIAGITLGWTWIVLLIVLLLVVFATASRY